MSKEQNMKNKMLKGTIILTVAGVITRVIGFLYRIFLANLLGDTKLGIYQIIFPIYGICFTLYASGLQTAVSQLVADPHLKNSKRVLKCGIFCSLCCSITLFVLLFTFSDWISIHLLFAKETAPLLRILSVIFPFCGITSIINGYFYGKRHAKVPSITQIIEQFCRVGFVVAVFFCFQKSISCEIAVLGLIVGEMASNIYNMWNIRKEFSGKKENSKSRYGELIKKLLGQAIPLSATRLTISVLSAAEAVLIPIMLQFSGLNRTDSFALYGITTGIVLPFILFPGTITNSLSVLLLPEVSKAYYEKDNSKIMRTTQITIKYSLLLGCIAMAVFVCFGPQIGTMFFHNPRSGKLLSLLSMICPFVYVSTTLASIINGLSKSSITFRNTVIGLVLRIAFLIMATPYFGIYGYLLGMLVSQILISILDGYYLVKRKYTKIDLIKWLVCPAILFISSCYIGKKLFSINEILQYVPSTVCLVLIMGTFLVIPIIILYKGKMIQKQDFY